MGSILSISNLKDESDELCKSHGPFWLTLSGIWEPPKSRSKMSMEFDRISNLPSDAGICLTSNARVANDQRHGSSNNLLKFFVHVPRIRRLHIENYLLKYLAVGVLPGKHPQPHRDLNFLSIHISFNDANDILTTFCLLRSFPALQELEIRANKEDQAVVGDVNYGLDNNQNCLFTKLRLVKITGISGVEAELDFIRFLLSSSPVLKKMIVAPATVNDFQLVKKFAPI